MQFSTWPFTQLGRILAFTFIFGAFLLNNLLQAFCQPVLYAKIMLLLFVSSFLLLPYLKINFFKNIALLFCGSGIPICLYCIYFLFAGNDGVGLPVFILLLFPLLGLFFCPFLILSQLIIIAKEINGFWEKFYFYLGLVLPFLILLFFIYNLNSNYKKTNQLNSPQEFSKTIPKTYFTERLLGRHWKYHTRICIYDGWRPPLHDPIFNLAYDIIGNEPERLNLNNQQRMQVYHAVFPELPLKEDCSCAAFSNDAKGYFEEKPKR